MRGRATPLGIALLVTACATATTRWIEHMNTDRFMVALLFASITYDYARRLETRGAR